MILSLVPAPLAPVAYYCERDACLAALLTIAKGDRPVASAWRVPMTARCASCGVDLFDRVQRQGAAS